MMITIPLTLDVILGYHVLFLDLDHDIIVYLEFPLIHFVGAQNQFALWLEKERWTESIVQGGLLWISDCLDVLQFLRIPETYLAGDGYRDDLVLGLVETDIDNFVVVSLYLFNLVLACPIHDA